MNQPEPLAYLIPEACRVARASRSAVYRAIRDGELRAVKRGTRTLILADDLKNWLHSLAPIAPSRPAQ